MVRKKAAIGTIERIINSFYMSENSRDIEMKYQYFKGYMQAVQELFKLSEKDINDFRNYEDTALETAQYILENK